MARILFLCLCAASAASAQNFNSGDVEMLATMQRVFPLWREAVDWETIEWPKYSKIIISGPQRSGTTWFAGSLAKHLDYVHLDEGTKTLLRDEKGDLTIQVTGGGAKSIHDLTAILRSPDRVVMQRPQWSHALHTLPAHPDLFVVFLARNCLDVFRSQNRIMSDPLGKSDTGWTCKFGRTLEWHWYHLDQELAASIDDEHDMICTMKQQAYQRTQRARMNQRGINTAPISYASSDSMGSYVPIEKRDKNQRAKEIATDKAGP